MARSRRGNHSTMAKMPLMNPEGASSAADDQSATTVRTGRTTARRPTPRRTRRGAISLLSTSHGDHGGDQTHADPDDDERRHEVESLGTDHFLAHEEETGSVEEGGTSHDEKSCRGGNLHRAPTR